jgi:UDP-N-acetylglucosamine pyrophosphorylase
MPDPFAEPFAEFEAKMRAAGCSPPAIRAFEHSYRGLQAQRDTLILIKEERIEPVTDLPRLEDLANGEPDHDLVAQTVVVKLNGGLGTSMGLEGPKSLLRLKEGLTFLDIIARQVLHARRQYAAPLHLLLMNSFNTSDQTRQFLRRYPELGDPGDLELLQSMVPKVDAESLRPARWPANPRLEWCPPGHGDVYPSLAASGWAQRLPREGVRYLFISNSDNLGATLDPRLLTYFATSGLTFLMEVAQRTPADKKGGHLVRYQGRLRLRESAQVAQEDVSASQDIERHRFFNTNNLWLRVDALNALLDRHGGFLPLPVIRNMKTLDPRDRQSPRVYQLEMAMGAALECFDNAGAIVVPRSRFAPVKTTSDLLALRSDAYRLTEDWQVVLDARRGGVPPHVTLDPAHYGMVDAFEQKFAESVPSLVECEDLTVSGPVVFGGKTKFRGKVAIANRAAEPRRLADGDYANCELVL